MPRSWSELILRDFTFFYSVSDCQDPEPSSHPAPLPHAVGEGKAHPEGPTGGSTPKGLNPLPEPATRVEEGAHCGIARSQSTLSRGMALAALAVTVDVEAQPSPPQSPTDGTVKSCLKKGHWTEAGALGPKKVSWARGLRDFVGKASKTAPKRMQMAHQAFEHRPEERRREPRLMPVPRGPIAREAPE